MAVKLKGTWTTESPRNPLPTILGGVAIVLIVVIGLSSQGARSARSSPLSSPPTTAAPSHSPSPAASRALAAPVRPR